MARGKHYKKKTKLDKAITVAIVISVIAVGIWGYQYIEKKNEEKSLLKQQEEIDKKLQEVKDEQEKIKEQEEKVKKEEIEKQCLEILKPYKDKNSDVIGVIEIAGTVIKYPILKGSDNSFYLDRDIEKNKNVNGSIFLDYKNNSDFSDKNSVIYGHNMKNGTMFGELKNYRDKEFLKKYPYINVYSEKEILKYRIFSVHVAESEYPYRIKKFDDEVAYEKFLKDIIEKSMIKGDALMVDEEKVIPTKEDEIITLSTCAYDFDDARLAVHAFKVE